MNETTKPRVSVVPQKLDVLLSELDSMIGLDEVKAQVCSLTNLLRVQALRKANGLPTSIGSLHMVFTGNPGTGKTTIARLIGGIFREIGLLAKGQMIETDRSALVGAYVGHTEEKTTAVIESALDGVLFIDEAYSLYTSSDNDFGRRAIDVLVKAMEDHRDRLVVIVAGYTEPMGAFIRANPGLKSRFPQTIEFPDYRPGALTKIFTKMAKDDGFVFGKDVLSEVHDLMEYEYSKRALDFGNARMVRNHFEAAQRRMADRLKDTDAPTKDQLQRIEPNDLGNIAEHVSVVLYGSGGIFGERCRAAREQLIAAAKSQRNSQAALDHILLVGSIPFGWKLVQVMAQEMGVGYRYASGEETRRAGDLAALLTNCEPRDLLFIDDIDTLPPSVVELLTPAMTDYQLEVIMGEEPGARTVRLDLSPFTIVASAIDKGSVAIPLRALFHTVAEMGSRR